MKTLIIILSLFMANIAYSAEIEEFKFHTAGSYTIINGVTDVSSGVIVSRIYCDGKYMGNGSRTIKFHTFELAVRGKCKGKLTLKYGINK